MAIFVVIVFVFLVNVAETERTVRLAIPDQKHIWPNGEIPYVFEADYPERHREAVLAAMQNIMFLTRVNGKDCVRFVPLTNQSYHVLILNTRCYSIIGRSTSHVTHMYVGGGCHSESSFKHELMHTLGFMHEQCRSDRDNYITVNWTNITPGHAKNFYKDDTYTHDLPYDYFSLIHYSWTEFSVDSRYATITPKKSGIDKYAMGRSLQLTPYDVLRIQRLYKCKPRGPVHASDLILPTHPPEPKDVCTFEQDTCGWTQATDDDFDWLRFKGHTPSPRTGPSFDVMGNLTGYYIYAEATGYEHKVTKLRSPVYPPGSYCLKMAYHMYGSHMGSLKVLTIANKHEHVHLDMTASLGDLWKHAEVHHYSVRHFQFELQATIGRGPYSDIAVDNLVVRHGHCSHAGHLIIG